MGGLCLSGVANSASVEVAADADTLWSVLSNLEESAAAISAVRDFCYLDRGAKGRFQVGTVVRETRVYQGDEYVCRRQIVAISDPPPQAKNGAAHAPPLEQQQQRSVSFSTSVPQMSNNFSNTSTLTAVPLTPDSAMLVGTYAMTSSGLGMMVYSCWWELCRKVSSEDSFVKELEDLAAAAEKKMAGAGDASNTR